jgi:hypothetical protein
MIAVPSPLEVATERSYEGESNVKLPPVVCESVTKTLVAFAVNASTTELVAIVSVVGYEESVICSAVEKLSEAAEAWLAKRSARKIRKMLPLNRVFTIGYFGIISFYNGLPPSLIFACRTYKVLVPSPV